MFRNSAFSCESYILISKDCCCNAVAKEMSESVVNKVAENGGEENIESNGNFETNTNTDTLVHAELISYFGSFIAFFILGRM